MRRWLIAGLIVACAGVAAARVVTVVMNIPAASGAIEETRYPYPDYAESIFIGEFTNNANPTLDSSAIGTNEMGRGAGVAEPYWYGSGNTTNGVCHPCYGYDGAEWISTNQIGDYDVAQMTAMVWFRSAGSSGYDDAFWGLSSDITLPTHMYLSANDCAGTNTYQIWHETDHTENWGALVTPRGRCKRDQNTWHHMAMVIDGVQPWVVYDGSNATLEWVENDNLTKTPADVFSATTPVTEANLAILSGAAGYWGWIGEVVVISAAASLADIQTYYWATCTNYGFMRWDVDNRDDWSNTVFVCGYDYPYSYDSSHVGTNNNALTGCTYTEDDVNGYLTMSGGYEMTRGVTNSLGAATEVTLACWVNLTTFSAYDGIIASYGATKAFVMDLRDANNKVGGYVYSGGTSYAESGINALTVGTWQHVAMVWQASDGGVDIYVDGILKGSDTGTAAKTALSYSDDFYVGNDLSDVGRNFQGLIDDVRIYKVALTSNEVYQLATGTAWNK